MHGIGESGTDHDFFAYDADGEVWNGSAFVTAVAADYLDYRIAAIEDGLGNFSAAAPEGMTRYELRVRGATLADSYVVWVGDDSRDNAAAAVALAAADQIIEEDGGVQVLRTYQRGTSTELLPAKSAKQPGGAALTDPTTERLAGYRE